jgi:hypothetical protein
MGYSQFQGQVKVLMGAALRLWEASRLPVERPLPGKPPGIPVGSWYLQTNTERLHLASSFGSNHFQSMIESSHWEVREYLLLEITQADSASVACLIQR